jgi:hypothetical protein
MTIKTAFARAEAEIDADEFVDKIERRGFRRRRARATVMIMAAAVGGSPAMLFASEAAALLGRRLALGVDGSASLSACLQPGSLRILSRIREVVTGPLPIAARGARRMTPRVLTRNCLQEFQ